MAVWTYRVTSDRTGDFITDRDAFAKALENSQWFKEYGETESELWWLHDEIKDAEDAEHFDDVLAAIYDLADETRCWIWFNHKEEA